MRTYMIYLLLTGKRLLRQLPYFLAGLAVMVLLVGMAAFSASKVLYGETSLKKIEVGVVLPEDDALSEKITKMIASLEKELGRKVFERKQHGIELTDDETEADIIIVNSCCFIGDAKEESINTILEMAEQKKTGC